jgi:preprotein translocase subunit SecD
VDFVPNAKFISLTDMNAGFGQTPRTKLGLDLEGGFEIKYGVLPNDKGTPTSAQMDNIRSIMEQRVNSTGATEPIVETVGATEILIQVPGAANKQEIEKLVGATGTLQFVSLPAQDYGNKTTPGSKAPPGKGMPIDPALPVQFTGADLDGGAIQAVNNLDKLGNWKIKFAFAGSKGQEFETWSSQHVGEYFAIVLDGVVQTAPVLETTITGGVGEITGSFTKEEAQSLATILQYGALPFPVEQESSKSIPATLGKTFLNQTVFAGAVGIGLVMLFMLLYYRLPGLVACVALVYYGVVVLALFRIIPVTLTLAGIAAFVISVGMAVDANILIFERTKEELRAGKTLATASEAGFSRAWNSIFDSNVSSLITAAILFMGGSSTIKGFALVLIIGVATSMFSAMTVSRTLMRVIVKWQIAQKAWLFGVTDAEFQARSTSGRLTRREGRARV